MWSEEDPVHPLYNGYEAIIDLIEQEADSLRTGKKRPGRDIAPPAKKPRAEVTRPRWVDQAETPVGRPGGDPGGDARRPSALQGEAVVPCPRLRRRPVQTSQWRPQRRRLLLAVPAPHGLRCQFDCFIFFSYKPSKKIVKKP
jgi:hypothetical protein